MVGNRSSIVAATEYSSDEILLVGLVLASTLSWNVTPYRFRFDGSR